MTAFEVTSAPDPAVVGIAINRVLKINGMILYIPDIVVYHESKGTVDKRLTKKKYLIQKEAHEYFNKNYGEA